MRTKTVVDGLKNSQRVRVIVDGVGVNTTVYGAACETFATTKHSVLAIGALKTLSLHRQAANRQHQNKLVGAIDPSSVVTPVPTGLVTDVWYDNQKFQVQVDLI